MLADRLTAISRAGVDTRQLLRSAISTGGPLPDDHAAAAAWWRISRHLTPTVTAHIDPDHPFTTARSMRLAKLVGADRADSLQSSRWWPPPAGRGHEREAQRLSADDFRGGVARSRSPDAPSVHAVPDIAREC
jgi:hypothetical protein